MPVHIEEHVWIAVERRLPSGGLVSWLPETGVQLPVPAVLEYIPYRKRDGTRARDDPMHGYFAQNGLAMAAVRVDMRQLRRVRWSVSRTSISQARSLDRCPRGDRVDCRASPGAQARWARAGLVVGGFNALQIAARRPPALKAIITTFLDRQSLHRRHPLHGRLPCSTTICGGAASCSPTRAARSIPEIVGPECVWTLARTARYAAAFLPGALAISPALRRLTGSTDRSARITTRSNARCSRSAAGRMATRTRVPRLLAGLKVPRLGISRTMGGISIRMTACPAPRRSVIFQEAVRWWDRWL